MYVFERSPDMHGGVVLAKGPLGRSNIYPCRNDLHEAVCFDRLRSYRVRI